LGHKASLNGRPERTTLPLQRLCALRGSSLTRFNRSANVSFFWRPEVLRDGQFSVSANTTRSDAAKKTGSVPVIHAGHIDTRHGYVVEDIPEHADCRKRCKGEIRAKQDVIWIRDLGEGGQS
jgi:hypothetical protein